MIIDIFVKIDKNPGAVDFSFDIHNEAETSIIQNTDFGIDSAAQYGGGGGGGGSLTHQVTLPSQQT